MKAGVRMKNFHTAQYCGNHYFDSFNLPGCASAWHADGCRFDPRIQQHSFVEISHELISMAMLSLPMTQVGHLSVTIEGMCT